MESISDNLINITLIFVSDSEKITYHFLIFHLNLSWS